MINVNNQNIKEILVEIHKSMQRKAKRGSQAKDDIILENRLFSVLCSDYDIGPTKCAIELNHRYDYNLTGDEVIQIFRNRKIANPVERKEILRWADEVAGYFVGAVEGKQASFEKFEKRRKEASLKNGKKHDSQERIAVLMIYEKYPELDCFDDTKSLELLGNTLARYFFYDMADAVINVYGFVSVKDEKKDEKKKEVEPQKQISYEQAIRKIGQIENALERTNTMLQDLQDEFEEQIEISKVKELADFFSMLNSEKYGCILDELLVVRKGVDELRKKNYELPMEINGLLIMVKKLIQFVRDSHIEPIMKINSIQEVVAADVEFCNYEGTPFTTNSEVKKVRVVSPGWVYKDKEIQISRPKVKEE